jgi:hypothetical protein
MPEKYRLKIRVAFDATEQMIEEKINKYNFGLTNVRLSHDKESGKPTGHAYVDFECDSNTGATLENLAEIAKMKVYECTNLGDATDGLKFKSKPAPKRQASSSSSLVKSFPPAPPPIFNYSGAMIPYNTSVPLAMIPSQHWPTIQVPTNSRPNPVQLIQGIMAADLVNHPRFGEVMGRGGFSISNGMTDHQLLEEEGGAEEEEAPKKKKKKRIAAPPPAEKKKEAKTTSPPPKKKIVKAEPPAKPKPKAKPKAEAKKEKKSKTK